MHIDFNKMRFITVAADSSACPEPDLPEIVLAGRSNSGKSSLVNALANRKDLSRVSSTPGKTRLVVYYGIADTLLLTDLPGYGYAKASRQEIQRYSGLADQYFQSGRPIHLALVLLDIRHEPSEADRIMMQFLADRKIPFMPIFNKSDKLSRAERMRAMTGHRNWLHKNGFSVEPLAVSTQSREGIDALVAVLSSFLYPDSI
ncbi:MAG: YihA family ribosome biogenesis GTP-binding protein [Clostridiaceae bacterium]|nr:YihA family ribosome biogenesis GTP-binding protein [Clostridiaceae bacterium]